MSYHDHCRTVFTAFRAGLGYDTDADRAALAKLRRIGPGDDVDRLETAKLAEVPGAIVALRKLKMDPNNSFAIERAAAAIGALATIRQPGRGSPARALRATMTEDRFNRTIRMQTSPERLASGRRVVRLLGGVADPGWLGADLFLWGPKVRTRWAFDYHGAEVPPAATDLGDVR